MGTESTRGINTRHTLTSPLSSAAARNEDFELHTTCKTR